MRHTPAFLRKDDGLGMTELAVAILVLGIVLIGLFPLMVDSVRLAQSNADIGQANRAVSSNIDRVRSQGIPGNCVSGSLSGVQNPLDLLESAPDGFDGTILLSCAGNPDGLVTVDVYVWKEGGDQTSALSSATTKVIAAP